MFLRSAPYVAVVLIAFLATLLVFKSEWGTRAMQQVYAFLTDSQTNDEVVAKLFRTDPCPSDRASVFNCWAEYYESVLTKYGSSVALFELKARYETGGYPRLYCHMLLHEIGKQAAQEYPSIAEAYAHGDTFCRAGYYHGVLEGVFGENGASALLNKLDSICVDIPGKDRYSYNYFSCVHGIGHGLMAYLDHDLFKSLAGCDKLTGEWEQSSCYGGVFMENIISDSPDEPSKFLKQNDPLYPCDAVADMYRYQCYLMQTSHMLTLYDGDFGTVFDACSAVETKYRTPCYQSLGRDASGWSYGSVDDALGYCAAGKTEEERGECLAGAAVDFIQSSGADAARGLCAKGDVEAQKTCSAAVEYQLSSL